MMAIRGGAVKFMGTKNHHDKWLRATENYDIKGCFAMSELGHGSNVCIRRLINKSGLLGPHVVNYALTLSLLIILSRLIFTGPGN